MKAYHKYRLTLGRLTYLLLTVMFMQTAARAVNDATFALIQTKTGVYSNVTVTTKAADYIVIQHSRGLASVKVAELPPDIQQELGYLKSEAVENSSSTAADKATALVNAIPTKNIEQAWTKYAPAGLPPVKFSPAILLAVLGGFAVLYLFYCYCASLICQKTGKPAGALIWVPVLQLIPLFRAADMSPAWLLAMLVPGLNIVAQIIWCFKIARARGKGALIAILLILPTHPLAFMYLAFSAANSPPDEKAPPKKYTPTSLVFDTA